MSKDFDEEMKRKLVEYTEVTDHDKNEVWNQLEKQLFTENDNSQSSSTQKVRKRKNPLRAAILTGAAAVLLFVGAQTETGYAIMNQIKEMFVPEKEVIQEMEGNEEEVNLILHEGTDYVIYVDEDFYRYEKGNVSDVIVPKEPLGEIYPEVSMEIIELPYQTPEAAIKEWEEQINETYEVIMPPEKVMEPKEGWRLHAIAGTEWDSPVINIHVVSNEREGSFLFIQKYFLEASEGHGVRFNEMIKEFYIITH